MATKVICHDHCCDDKEVRIKCVTLPNNGGIRLQVVTKEGMVVSNILDVNEAGVYLHSSVSDVGILRDATRSNQIARRN